MPRGARRLILPLGFSPAKAGVSSAAPGFLISMRFRSLCSLFKERVQAFFNKGKGCAMPLDESGRVV